MDRNEIDFQFLLLLSLSNYSTMKSTFIIFFLVSFCISVSAQQKNNFEDWFKKPASVSPGENNLPPSDAIILFEKSNLDNWQYANGEQAKWDVSGNVFSVKK